MIAVTNELLVHVALLSAGALLGMSLLTAAAHFGSRDRRIYLPFALTSLAGTIVFLALAALYDAKSLAQAAVALRWHATGAALVGPALVWCFTHVSQARIPRMEIALLGFGTLVALTANAALPAGLHFTAIESPSASDGADARRLFVGRVGAVTYLYHLWLLVPTFTCLRLGLRVWRTGDRAMGITVAACALVYLSANVSGTRTDLTGGRVPYGGGIPVALLFIVLLGISLGAAHRRQRLALVANGESLRQANVQLREEMSRREGLEQRLGESLRMESLGLMAASVAHDFNNVLTVVGGRAAFLQRRIAADTEDGHDLDAIVGAAERGADLTRQLLAFARRQDLEPTALDPDQLIRGSRELLAQMAGPSHTLELELDANGCRVFADGSQLLRVFMNLIVNARDAMPDGGRVTLRTCRASRMKPRCACGGAIVGEHVAIEVADTGIGIDAAVLPHIFEPFFTTKGGRSGTGLGLSTVHGIVTQSGGIIAVASEPDRGATFRICLPCGQGGAAPEPIRAETAGAPIPISR